MKNADKFKDVFGLYATEVWSMPEKGFLRWLNSEYTEPEPQWIHDAIAWRYLSEPYQKENKHEID